MFFWALCLLVLYFVIPEEGVLEFSERDCLLLFDCTSSDFFDKEMDFYEETGDFRKNARINGEGNLEIHFDEKQMIAWKESAWLNVFNDIENCPYANLSTNLSVLTIRCKTIKVQYQTLDMQTRTKNFTGWTAQIIQHEVDHCNGVLI